MLAVLNWLLGIFLSLILKGITAGKYPMAIWLKKLTLLQSQKMAVRLQPQAYSACMERL